MTPTRIQRSRREKYPECGITLTVTRPGVFGNPFVVCGDGMLGWWIENNESVICGFSDTRAEAIELAIRLYRFHLKDLCFKRPAVYAAVLTRVREADYLACWCPVGAPCHADVWMELAKEGADYE